VNSARADVNEAAAKGNYEVALAKAKGDYAIAKKSCEALSGDSQKNCKEQAEADLSAAKANAEMLKPKA
jgi:hypothetical protein